MSETNTQIDFARHCEVEGCLCYTLCEWLHKDVYAGLSPLERKNLENNFFPGWVMHSYTLM